MKFDIIVEDEAGARIERFDGTTLPGPAPQPGDVITWVSGHLMHGRALELKPREDRYYVKRREFRIVAGRRDEATCLVFVRALRS